MGQCERPCSKKPELVKLANNQTEKSTEEKPQTEKIEEEKPREEKPKNEKAESPKPKEPVESEEESPSEPEEPQVETEKVEEKLREAEELLKKIKDPILKSNANETLTGLKNNLLFGSQDNNTIMAEAEKLLVLLRRVSNYTTIIEDKREQNMDSVLFFMKLCKNS